MFYGFDIVVFFFFKQKTAYEMRIRDWSSDVCSSDLWGDKSLHRRAASIPTMRQTPQLPALRGLSPDLETRLPQHPASRRSRPGVGEAGRLTPAGADRNRIPLRCRNP